MISIHVILMRTVVQTTNQYEDKKIILRWPISDLVLPQVKEMMGKIIIISWKLGHGSMVPSVSGIMLVGNTNPFQNEHKARRKR